MPTRLNPYLGFRDNAREAMDFYHSVFGGELTRSTFAEFQAGDPAEQDKIMHSMLVTENGLVLMGGHPELDGLHAGRQLLDLAERRGRRRAARLLGEARRRHGDHAPGARAVGDTFGMCVDRYGVSWLVNIAGSGS